MDFKRPPPMRSTLASKDHSRYCDFDQDHGHTMEECNSLKFELEGLAHKGMLNEYISSKDQLKFVRENGQQSQSPRDASNMIVNLAQKRKFNDAEWKSQPITFTQTNLDGDVTPQNDPLVTSVIINNREVQCVLVDTGSTPNIMYYHCFESLSLNPALLQKYNGHIYGFNNQLILMEGVLRLNVAFGLGRTYVTPSVRFLVVKMVLSFNIVIKRPTLTKIWVVVS
ncbi:hypothetical protein SLEP1_g20750 [Rubroshorea leprosula]|uniref:Uncharacterized protein n=1 Tax=Rubroshorea leprosula TaxID=152421 RepID=A0AAV5J9S7_9ROSI|nr:hypothetical protein SLEP1_g20750 [Rubroshorea leprosula]